MCARVDFIEQSLIEDEADFLEEGIIKFFAKYGANIDIPKWWHNNSRFIFKIKLKGNTRETHVRANASDVQTRLKLPIFYVVKNNFTLYIIASQKKIEYDHLPVLLHKPDYQKAQERARLPYVVGHDILGNIVMDDLAQFPHLILGGSTNSGKSVGLQALITTIAYSKSPSKANFILIDVGATDLMPFEGLPHLSCPVVRERTTAIQALADLVTEMERRIDLGYTSPASFKQLPRPVLVIDEFPALFTGINKDMSKTLTNSVSSLLQRGRHAKIHVVLAAQNPTYQNMKVDLGNITTRIAFKCAKKNFSETILGEGGAETLMGHGDLLLRSPRYDSPSRIQGIYITPDELRQSVQQIKATPLHLPLNKFNLDIPDALSTATVGNLVSPSPHAPITRGPSDDKTMFAMVVLHVLTKTQVSTNSIMKDFGFGWNRADRYMKQLEEWGIVSEVIGKQARRVLPISIKDLPSELIAFMGACGISENSLCDAFAEMS